MLKSFLFRVIRQSGLGAQNELNVLYFSQEAADWYFWELGLLFLLSRYIFEWVTAK